MTDEEEVRRFGKEEIGKKSKDWNQSKQLTRLPEIQTGRDERDRFFLSILG